VGRRFRAGFKAEHIERAEGDEKKDRKGARLRRRPLQPQKNGKKAA